MTIEQANMSSCIVRILRGSEGEVEGIGFLVNETHVVTCAHVVGGALNYSSYSQEPPQASVEIDFPGIPSPSGLPPRREAKIVAWYPTGITPPDDIAVLKLSGELPPQAGSAVINATDKVQGHSVRVFGAPQYFLLAHTGEMLTDRQREDAARRGQPIETLSYVETGVYADGQAVDRMPPHRLHMRGFNAQAGEGVRPGYSGGPVWDLQLNCVIGMVVETNELFDNQTAYAIPAEYLLQALSSITSVRSGTTEQWLDTLPLPENPLPLIERKTKMNEVKQKLFALKDGGVIVLHGLPGVGKTYFAQALVHDQEVQEHFQHGILWAEIGRKPTQQVPQILGKWYNWLGVNESRGESAASQGNEDEVKKRLIHKAIGDKRMLIVLEDVPEIEAIQSLLVGNRNCVYLITGHEPRLAQHRQIHDKATALHLPELDAQEGRDLMAQLAPQVVAKHPTEINTLLDAVGGISLMLDLFGRQLQLAQESDVPGAVEARLNELLQNPNRWRDGKLDAVISASYDALKEDDGQVDEEAQRTLRMLSVLPSKPNDFSHEAAERIVATTPTTFVKLVRSGLLQPIAKGRYTLHQMIKDNVAAKLGDAECHLAQDRLVDYYVKFIEDHQNNISLLDLEDGNILRALSVAADSGNMYVDLMRGAIAIAKYVEERGIYAATCTYFERAERAARERNEHDPLITILGNRGYFEEKQGSYEQANKHLTESLELSRRKHWEKTVDLLHRLAIVAYNRAEYDEAEKHLQEGLELAKALNDPERQSRLHQRWGLVQFCRGAFRRAETEENLAWEFAEQVPVGDHLVKQELQALILLDRARIALKMDDFATANTCSEQGRDKAKGIGSTELIAAFAQIQGRIAAQEQRWNDAAALFDDSLDKADKIGHRWYKALFLNERGKFYVLRAQHAKVGTTQAAQSATDECLRKAETDFLESAAMAQKIGSPDLNAFALHGLGRIAKMRNDHDKARSHSEKSKEILRGLNHYKYDALSDWVRDLPL